MRFLRRSLTGIFLLGATLALVALAGNTLRGAIQERLSEEEQTRPTRERVFAVNVVTFDAQSLAPEMTAFGEVQSRRTLDLRSAAGGIIVEIGAGFEDGGAVSAGDLLIRIDPVDAEAALARVKADVLEAEANHRDAERGLELARDELIAAQDQARLRNQALERQIDLQSRGVGTAAAVETAELAVSSANQAVLVRRQGISTAEAQIDQTNTQLARVLIDLAEAERTLADTEVRAAFDGILGSVDIVQGRRVGANEALGQLIDPDALEVAFRISTAQYARLLNENGSLITIPVQAKLDIGGVDLTAQGVISRESAAVGEGQTGRLIFARLEAPRGFRPGDFVTITITEPILDRVALLPSSALDGSNRVLVLTDDERLEEVDVELLRRQGNDVIVRAAGLQGRDIVAERSPLLGAGIKVRALTPEGSAAPEAPATVALDDERRARLVAFVEANNRMPAEAKARVLSQLEAEEVPTQVVERLEARMGG
jgi:multidrug efflux pump subunit AcrA (membrane-fusion protein)